MNNTTWDWALFETLNFDGPEWLDTTMQAVSGKIVWIPLYILILYMVYRRWGWRGIIAFVIAIAATIALSDIIAGIFKHQGPLKNLLPSFPARIRPMYTEGLDFTQNGYGMAYLYGTVSGHTATIISIAILASTSIRRAWFTWLMVVVALLVCYSRIYLACHFPQDILLGALVGVSAGLCGIGIFRLGLKYPKRGAKI